VWFCLRDPVFSRFSGTPTCDGHGHRHRRTQGHRIYRASIASRGKSYKLVLYDAIRYDRLVALESWQNLCYVTINIINTFFTDW